MHRVLRVAIALLIAITTSTAVAKPFEPEFTIVRLTGEVKVTPPKARRAVKAQIGESYPYGTTVETMRNATAVIRFSEGNTCRVSARTELTVTEQTKNKKLKILELAEGKVDLDMNEMVEGESLQIETASAVCGITGTSLSNETFREGDVNATVIKVKEGNIWVNGEFFEIDKLDDGTEIICAVTDDNDYVRIRVVMGVLTIRLQGANGPEDVNIDDGDLIRIYSRTSQDGKSRQITTLIYEGTDEGTEPKQTLVYTEALGGGTDTGGDGTSTTTTTVAGGGGTTTTTGGPGGGLDDLVVTTTSTTTPSTTTTTVRSPTPVGLR